MNIKVDFKVHSSSYSPCTRIRELQSVELKINGAWTGVVGRYGKIRGKLT